MVILEFYMGKNTPDRQDFIIENLRIEEDIIEEEGRRFFKEVQILLWKKKILIQQIGR